MLICRRCFTAIAIWCAANVPIHAQDVDLSGFEETGESLIEQLRDNNLALTAVVLILLIIGFLAIFTKFIDWKWIGVTLVGLFFIFGGDNIAESIIAIFKG
jgi:type IV secretory pathway VirB2 component (pilin)